MVTVKAPKRNDFAASWATRASIALCEAKQGKAWVYSELMNTLKLGKSDYAHSSLEQWDASAAKQKEARASDTYKAKRAQGKCRKKRLLDRRDPNAEHCTYTNKDEAYDTALTQIFEE